MREYKRFGVMLDVSRNGVLKVEKVKRIMDYLKEMGYNMVELYCEDTYEIEGEPYFGYMRGRYTADEIKEMDAYANSKGIELIPCIQTLAHFTNLVRHKTYHPIVDTDDILLIDEPKTYELIEKMFKTLKQNFTSRNVNIGMDEAHMVGRGKYFDLHGNKDRYEILIRHLNRVADIAKKYGFKAHMWSDMFFRLTGGEYYDVNVKIPEHVKKLLPENVNLTYWDYYHKDEEFYDKMFDIHEQFGDEVWFAGGAWTWVGFAPLYSHTFNTMKPAMKSAMRHNVNNVMITMWGDNGKECSFFAMLPALYAIRRYADGEFDERKVAKEFDEKFGLSFNDFIKLEYPNRHYLDEQITDWQNPCKSILYSDPFMGVVDAKIENVIKNTGKIPFDVYAKELENAKERAGEFGYIFHSLSKLCSALSIKATLGLDIRSAYKAGDKKKLIECANACKETAKRVEEFHDAFFDAWHIENKPHGFEVQDARLGGVVQRLKTCAKRLIAYANGQTEKIDELEESLVPPTDNIVRHNDYKTNVTYSAL